MDRKPRIDIQRRNLTRAGFIGMIVFAITAVRGGNAVPSHDGKAGRDVVPPAAVKQFQNVIGDRIEAVTILGGDYASAGGLYGFRGGKLVDLSVTKLGGGGEVANAQSLGESGLKWAPVLQGNIGHITSVNEFTNGYLRGNKSEYEILALAGGGGVRWYFTDRLSLATTISGIYGHTENNFEPQNALGELVDRAAKGTYVDWQVDTWTVMPSLGLRYEWRWRNSRFEFSSNYSFFHTESFYSSSNVVGVSGDSQTWENKLDADIPLGLRVFGRELHTGGFVSRTEFAGGVADAFNADHAYTVNGRLVVDVEGKLWKFQWIGLGCSYIWSDHFNGWTAGLDMQFQF